MNIKVVSTIFLKTKQQNKNYYLEGRLKIKEFDVRKLKKKKISLLKFVNFHVFLNLK